MKPESNSRHSTLTFRIREFLISDLNHAMKNEIAAYDFAWNQKHFEDCLQAEYPAVVLEIKEQRTEQDNHHAQYKMIGHGIISVGAGESHLLNICVNPNVQNQGWGKVLLNHLLKLAEDKGAEWMFLEVRPSNLSAIHLYQAHEFTEVGRRKYYYPSYSGREDALVFSKQLVKPKFIS